MAKSHGLIKTIDRDRLSKLSLVNSRTMPQRVNDHGRVKQWVGIGWVPEPSIPDPRLTLVTDHSIEIKSSRSLDARFPLVIKDSSGKIVQYAPTERAALIWVLSTEGYIEQARQLQETKKKK